MPYFNGGTLGNFVDQRGTLSVEHLVAVARQIASGMQAAHERGILHRDLKPDNVLLRTAQEKTLSDEPRRII
jgi:serine/threonine protein kinase